MNKELFTEIIIWLMIIIYLGIIVLWVHNIINYQRFTYPKNTQELFCTINGKGNYELHIDDTTKILDDFFLKLKCTRIE